MNSIEKKMISICQTCFPSKSGYIGDKIRFFISTRKKNQRKVFIMAVSYKDLGLVNTRDMF